MPFPLLSAGDAFVACAATGFTVAPALGALHPTPPLAARVTGALASVGLWAALAVSWASVPKGVLIAMTGAIAVSAACLLLFALGRLCRRHVRDPLIAGLIGVGLGVAVTIGPFALGNLSRGWPSSWIRLMLAAHPLTTAASAAGIDLLHLDYIYRLSPLAHRGVLQPDWSLSTLVTVILFAAAWKAGRALPQES